MAGYFKILGRGRVEDVATNKKGDVAKLQFLTKTDEGLKLFDVKVEGAKKEDLEKFVNKEVELDDLKIVQIDFNTFYKIDDITKIKVLGQGGQK